MNQNEHWIPVETSKGMFSSERAVTLRLADGKLVSFFADKNLLNEINEKDGRAFLRVALINSYPEQHNDLVLLPTETFETGSPWAVVPTR